MPERTVITEGTQIGVETTAGTAVPAGKRLRTVGITLDPEFNARSFRPSGNKFTTLVAPGKEWVGGALEGAADYEEIIYPLSMAWGAPVITTPGGGATSRQHAFTVVPSAAQDPKTYTVERGSAVRAERATYVFANDLGLTFNRDEINVEGAVMGRRIEDAATLTVGPTAAPESPILPEHVSVYFDPLFANLKVTKLLRVLESAHSVSSRFGSLWPLDAAQASFVTAFEVEPSTEATLVQVADAAGMAHLPRARAGTVGFLVVEAIGPIIEGIIPYTYRAELPVKVTDWAYGDRDGLKTAEWTFEWIDDATAGYVAKFIVINTRTAL